MLQYKLGGRTPTPGGEKLGTPKVNGQDRDKKTPPWHTLLNMILLDKPTPLPDQRSSENTKQENYKMSPRMLSESLSDPDPS